LTTRAGGKRKRKKGEEGRGGGIFEGERGGKEKGSIGRFIPFPSFLQRFPIGTAERRKREKKKLKKKKGEGKGRDRRLFLCCSSRPNLQGKKEKQKKKKERWQF